MAQQPLAFRTLLRSLAQPAPPEAGLPRLFAAHSTHYSRAGRRSTRLPGPAASHQPAGVRFCRAERPFHPQAFCPGRPALFSRLERLGPFDGCDHRNSHLLHTDPDALQLGRRKTLLDASQPEQEMFCTDVVMLEVTGFKGGLRKHFSCPPVEFNNTAVLVVPMPGDKLNGHTQLIQLHAEVTQHFCSNTIPFAQQSQQEVFCADMIVLEMLCLLLCQLNYFSEDFRRSWRWLFCTPLRRGTLGVTEHHDRLRAHPFQLDAQPLQHARGQAFAFAHQPQQEMLRADIMMIEAASLVDGEFDHFLGARGEADLAEDNTISTANDKFNGGTNLVQVYAEVVQYFCRHTFALAHEPT